MKQLRKTGEVFTGSIAGISIVIMGLLAMLTSNEKLTELYLNCVDK